jgi:hypothetical protein
VEGTMSDPDGSIVVLPDRSASTISLACSRGQPS